MMKKLIACALVTAALSLNPLTPAYAQERPCMSSMSHLMEAGVCKQRMGCLRTHLQWLSKACLTRLSAQNEKRFLQMKHHKTGSA